MNVNKKITGAAALLLSLAASIQLQACGEPELFCASATGEFAFRLDKKSGGDCFPAQTTSFAVMTGLGKGDNRPDYATAKLFIGFTEDYNHWDATVTSFETGDEMKEGLFSASKFKASNPDGKDLCFVDKMDNSVDLPEVLGEDADTMMEVVQIPARKASYKWSDVQLETSPAVQGSKIWGKLEVDVDGCQATYDTIGVWPAIHCEEKAECFPPCSQEQKDANECPTAGLSPDWESSMECLEGWCVFKDTKRK